LFDVTKFDGIAFDILTKARVAGNQQVST
jgi:hypothetical protein